MKTALLRKVRYPRRSCRTGWIWDVPGFCNPVVLHFEHTFWKVPAVTWPHRPGMFDRSEIVRGARLDWHRSVIKNELRALLSRMAESPKNV